MLRSTSWSSVFFCALLVFGAAHTCRTAEPTARSEWVYPGADGKLIYKTTSTGDKIMDFSHAGYMGGGVALPAVPVKRTVQPSGGEDDTALVQAAIDSVAVLPLENGIRGAVLLAPGTFPCSSTLTISASGVVLRGSGSGSTDGPKSTIKMTGKPHNSIAIRAPRDAAPAPVVAAQTSIVNAYLPSGEMNIHVADATGFSVGDTISIKRPVTPAWLKFMQMEDLVRDGKVQTWLRAGSSTVAERRIVAITQQRLTLDVPLSDSYPAIYLDPPGTSVAKIRPSTLPSQIGIENLHIESPPQTTNHAQPHFTALRLSAQDSWVRDVLIDETMNSVGINGRRITLERVAVTRKALHPGASKPAEFAPNGTQVLLDRCGVTGDNIWFVATGGGVSGPVVALNCTFKGKSRAESHQRWATGMLYDSCRASDGGLEFRNRGSMGSGHGWSMGWGVIWNCEAADYIVQNPPGSMNWLIGSSGANKSAPRPFGTGPNLPQGTVDSSGTPVTPKSLYLAQLAERLGAQALKNIGY